MKVFTLTILLTTLSLLSLLASGQKEEPPMMENAMMMIMESSEGMDGEMGPFIDYKNPEQAMMLAEEKPTVLFFNASWCPTCKEAREDFAAHGEDLEGINLILVDYDNSDDLQMKYGVTYQHTFVQIDPMGNALAQWNGGGTKELLMNRVKEEM